MKSVNYKSQLGGYVSISIPKCYDHPSFEPQESVASHLFNLRREFHTYHLLVVLVYKFPYNVEAQLKNEIEMSLIRKEKEEICRIALSTFQSKMSLKKRRVSFETNEDKSIFMYEQKVAQSQYSTVVLLFEHNFTQRDLTSTVEEMFYSFGMDLFKLRQYISDLFFNLE